MGKQSPTPPPEPQSLSIQRPPPPSAPESLSIPRKPQSDPDIERVLKQIDERQAKTADDIKNMTTEKMAFGMMRAIPRDKWNTPLTELGHWPRGSSIAEIKADPKLKNLTPAQAMLKLFEMSDKKDEKK